MKQLDVSDYDVVLMSSTYCAKYVKLSPKALAINYCHQPFRLAWYPESYAEFLQAKGLKKLFLEQVTAFLRQVDYKAAQRTDFFIANTPETAQKIREKYLYAGPIDIIYPPVVNDKFYKTDQIKDYYLVVTRLEFYKRVDLVIEAFNLLGLPLIIVGKGSKEAELKKTAKSNIVFKSGLSALELQKLYAECKAFIFPQEEDFGITPLEANASGRPVIAFGKGGVLHTMVPLERDIKKSTAIFFGQQDVPSLVEAIKVMEKNYLDFDPGFIEENSKRFDEKRFIKEIKEYVNKKYFNYKIKLTEKAGNLI
jgi:glycosyltransferase involved in cell wall biosynthesis